MSIWATYMQDILKSFPQSSPKKTMPQDLLFDGEDFFLSEFPRGKIIGELNSIEAYKNQ